MYMFRRIPQTRRRGRYITVFQSNIGYVLYIVCDLYNSPSLCSLYFEHRWKESLIRNPLNVRKFFSLFGSGMIAFDLKQESCLMVCSYYYYHN